MKNEKYEFTEEQIKTMSYYERRSFLIAELNSGLVKNRETDDYDYIDLKGINQVLQPLKCKYKISDIPCKESNNDMSLIMIDALTGKQHEKLTVPWPGLDPEHNDMRAVQIVGANITYLRRYLLMWAYDINVPKDFYDEKPLNLDSIPEIPTVRETSAEEKKKESSELTHSSKGKWVENKPTYVQGEVVSYDPETGEEELRLDPNRGRKKSKQKNIYEDAENYIVKEGNYAGVPLCEIADTDPDELVAMARQGNIIEPELQKYAEILIKKRNL